MVLSRVIGGTVVAKTQVQHFQTRAAVKIQRGTMPQTLDAPGPGSVSPLMTILHSRTIIGDIQFTWFAFVISDRINASAATAIWRYSRRVSNVDTNQ
ncbi:MAG: hypothetical protein AAFN70_19435 [Planctomycetota bacterium]